MLAKKQITKSALLGLLALLLLNFPFISIPNKIALIFSIPILYVYVFGLWLFLIGLLFFVVDKRKSFKK